MSKQSSIPDCISCGSNCKKFDNFTGCFVCTECHLYFEQDLVKPDITCYYELTCGDFIVKGWGRSWCEIIDKRLFAPVKSLQSHDFESIVIEYMPPKDLNSVEKIEKVIKYHAF